MSKKYVSKDVVKKIHDQAAPLIKWLKEAEEEDSDSDEEEEAELQVTSNWTIWKLISHYHILHKIGVLC